MAGEDRRINVGLSFTADTSKAREALDKLRQDISKVTVGKEFGTGFDDAITRVQKFQGILETARNTAGGLDLTKLNKGLSAAGMNLDQVFLDLNKIGANDAFQSLGTEILNANANVSVLHGALKKFADGLKNTAMWTIQSNAIHAVESALSNAYGYAQKLNKGLTDIAIVSDLNTQQLTEFARTANQMAKELSASTADYVSGALIYYQAGLSDEEVIERTNTTIKLAETSGESAEAISSYMTAIWNNFYDGSKSVEYYADAISYLGAVTAASNADIAEGMQAFSAVANTVGLSFEYGASALTLLRDITQQSASTIGNSLKTIFARLSSVAQGESLEDGVDLTKYSKALEQVGVSVLDATGNLRQMDDILDDLGARWDSLNEAQKVALAQTVGGVRQYNNLISLMDNYEQFQELVQESSQSDGYLQGQADKYAESWEAAANRLEAAWQGIYDQIIDDKFFIKLTNFLTGIVNFIGDIIDGLGGLKGLIPFIVMTVTSINPDKTALGLEKIVQELINFKNALDGTQKSINVASQNTALKWVQGKIDILGASESEMSPIYGAQEKLAASYREINALRAEGKEAEAIALAESAKRYNNLIELAGEVTQQLVQNRDAQEEFNSKIAGIDLNNLEKTLGDLELYQNIYGDLSTPNKKGQVAYARKIAKNPESFGLDAETSKSIQNLGTITKKNVDQVFTILEAKLKDLQQQVEQSLKPLVDKQTTAETETTQQATAALQEKANALDDVKEKEAASTNAVENATDKVGNQTEAQKLGNEVLKEHNQLLAEQQRLEGAQTNVSEKMGNYSPKSGFEDEKAKDWSKTATAAIRAGTAIMSMNSAMDAFYNNAKNGTLTLGNLLSSFTSIGMAAMNMSSMLQKGGAIAEAVGAMGGVIPQWLAGPLGPVAMIAIMVALKIAIGGLVALFKKWQAETTAGKIEATTTALENQKNVVKDLTSAYSNLQSTINNLTSAYDDLQEAASKYGIGSPQYLLALEQYNAQLDELKEKYGDGIFDITVDANGNEIRKINEDALAGRQLQELNTAKAYEAILQNNLNDLQVQQKRESLQTMANGSGYIPTSGNGEVTIGYNTQNQRAITIAQEQYKEAWDKIEEVINSSNPDFSKLEQYLNTLDEEAAAYFRKLLTPYQQALAARESGEVEFSDLAKNVMTGHGVYAMAADNGISEETLNRAMNLYTDLQYNNLKDDKDTIESAREEWAESQGYQYNGNNQFTNANGEKIDSSEIPETQELVKAYIQGAVLAELQDFNSDAMKDILASAGLGTDAIDSFIAEMAHNAAEALRLAGAQEDITTSGQDAEEVSAVAKEIDHLVDSEEKLDETQRKFSKATKDNEGSLKKLSSAAEQTQEGFDELEKGYQDWYKAIKGNDELAKAKAMTELKDSLSDVMDITDELQKAGMTLGDHFGDYIIENQDTVLKALEGDRDAILELQKVAAEDILLQLDPSALEMSMDEAMAMIGDQMNWIAQMLDSGQLKLGAVDNTELLGSLENTINALTNDVNQAEAILAAMGFDAEVEKETVNKTTSVWHPAEYETKSLDTTIRPFVYESLKTPGYWSQEETGETVTALKIKTADYVGGGNILGAKGGTGAGKQRVKTATKPSGGGSSSKPKTKAPDRYHEINAKIQQNQAEVTKLTALESRLYGQEKLDAMEREAELLEEQAKLYEQKYQEALRYYEMDKKNLQNNYGATFNPDGTIANYDEWYGKYLAQYNSGKMDDDAWSKFEDAIKKYEESLNLLDETEKAKLDATNKAFDKGLENIEYRLKTINELIDKDIDYLDYMIKQLDKSMYDTADVIALIGKKTEDVYQKTLNEQKAIEDILKHHGGLSDEDIARFISGQEDISDIIAKVKDLTETEVKNLMEHQSALIKYNETLIELREEAYEKLGESIDEFNDKIERQKDIISDLDGVMNHYRNIIDIVGKDTLGISDEMLRQMSELSVTAAKGALEISRDELTKNQAMLEGLYKRREELLAAGREADARLLDKEIEAQEDRVRQLSEAWASAWEDALHAAEEAFKNSIQLATDAFSQAMAGTIGSLDDLQEAMDMQNTLNERYLPTYQKIYELNKLTRDVNNAIDNTNNIAGKERLLKLQQDIVKKQEDGAELTEYELGMFQRRLELEQARIAMEEAQNAKNMVRMTRDSEGNWSYTYTADSEAAAQAEQNYEDKLYDLKKYNQDSMKEFEDAMWQAVNEYKNSIADLDLTDEERAQRIHDFQQQWVEHNKDMFQMTLDDAQWILDTYGGVDDLINTFMETISGKTTEYSDLTDFFNQFNESSQQMMDEVGTSYRTWDEQYRDIFEKAGTSADDFKDKVTEDMKAIEESIVGEDGEGGAVGAAKELGDQMTEQFDGIMENLRKWFEGEDGGYSKMIDNIVSQNEKLYGSIQALLSAYAKLGQVSNFAGDNKDIKVGEVDTGTGQGEIPGFASGGYTGSWGNTGRLAVLHEKELVLNQADTENLLTTVNFVRDLTRMISLNAADASAGLGNLFMGGVGQGGGYLDQTVTIHAEFPNATNHSEIEEAFSNLIGLASQYAGRKK